MLNEQDIPSYSISLDNFFKMEDLCEKLDHLIVECFDSLECLQEKREYLNASIRGGHLYLSKARHSMGNKSVGALQYSHKMDRPLYHVVVYLETFHRAVRKRCCNVWNGENTVKKRKGYFESWLFWKRRGGKHSQKKETSKFRCFEQCMKQVVAYRGIIPRYATQVFLFRDI